MIYCMYGCIFQTLLQTEHGQADRPSIRPTKYLYEPNIRYLLSTWYLTPGTYYVRTLNLISVQKPLPLLRPILGNLTLD